MTNWIIALNTTVTRTNTIVKKVGWIPVELSKLWIHMESAMDIPPLTNISTVVNNEEIIFLKIRKFSL
jgi:hypothetical protein